MELTQELIGAGINLQSVADFIEKRTDQRLSQDALKRMRKDIKNSLIVSRAAGANIDPSRMSAADRLLFNLENDPDSLFVALFADYDTPLLATPKIVARSKRRESHSIEVECQSTDGEIHRVTSVGNVWLGNAEESPATVSKKIRDALRVSCNGDDDSTPKILLCIAWTTKEQRRLAEMYPEVLGTDLTNKVNNEKRPLCLGVGVDAKRRNFTWVSAFFPSKARWVFDWFFGVSLPALFTERTLHNIRLSITDEDERCFSAFQALSGDGKTFPLADSRLCSWHKINRGLRKTLSSRIENMR